MARATGSLRDTVNPLEIKDGVIEGNGFLFEEFTTRSFYDAMERCLAFFRQADEAILYEARKNVESSICYWDKSAMRYIEEIYSKKEIIREEVDRIAYQRSCKMYTFESDNRYTDVGGITKKTA